jgi:hypothetical protein
MKTDLYSIADTAKALGVSRRTIERAMSAGRLRWHGASRRGRYARGLRVEEARQLVTDRNPRAPAVAGLERQHKTSVVNRSIPGGWIWPMRCILLAAYRGADVDLLSACVRIMRQPASAEYIGFVLMLIDSRGQLTAIGEDMSFEVAVARAVLELCKTRPDANEHARLEDSLASFQTAWRALSVWLRAAPVNVFPSLVWEDRTPPSARFRFSPKWCSQYAPSVADAYSADEETWHAASDWFRAEESIINPARALASLGGARIHRAAAKRVFAAATCQEKAVSIAGLVHAACERQDLFRESRASFCRACTPPKDRQRPTAGGEPPPGQCSNCRARWTYRKAAADLGIERQDIILVAKAFEALSGGRDSKGRTGIFGRGKDGQGAYQDVAGVSEAAAWNRDSVPLASKATRSAPRGRLAGRSGYMVKASHSEIACGLGISRASYSQLVAREKTRRPDTRVTLRAVGVECPVCGELIADTDTLCLVCGHDVSML